MKRSDLLERPPGPFRASFWKSSARGRRVTATLGLILLPMLTIVIVTGLLSYAAYNPRLTGNDNVHSSFLHFYLFDWPVTPSWLYRLNQGLHVTIGVALVPIVLVKLWSVLPRLFEWPPVRSPAHLLERISLLALVGGILFELVTGLLNISNDYVFGFSFYTAHLYGAVVFLAGFVVHVSLKLRLAYRAVRRRETPKDGPDELAAPDPGPSTISRRGVVAVAGGSSLVVAALYAGQTIGGPFRATALLSPRGGPGSPSFPVNRTARTARVARAGDEWRLTLVGTSTMTLSRADLLAMRQVTAGLPIACVEGWSSAQTWGGVPLMTLGRLVGLTKPVGAYVESLEKKGAYRHVSLSRRQVGAAHTLLALKCGGKDLTLDHGYPARLIIPAAPGVHNTKWVSKVTFDV
ncbi:MAG TPA: molybdopterin-dependent oxidoreductase [Frankiaceae bacterium]|nr:molybdopterin-dependent oxidoreductase [Frankiaceae bacterium]